MLGDGPLGADVDRESSPDHTPPFSLLSLPFLPVNGIRSGACALKGNVTEENRAEFGVGLLRIQSQLFIRGLRGLRDNY